MSNNKTTTESFTLTVTDNDSAASERALFVCFTGSDRPYLACNCANSVGSEIAVTATDANGNTITDYLYVTHNADPGSNLDGVALACDDDNTAGVLQANLPQSVAVHLFTMRYGAAFKVRHASSGGVATYFDDDGATATARLVCVNANNASVTQTSDQNVSSFYVASHLNDL